MLLDALTKELAAKGALTVLREGFKCAGKSVNLAYFAPNTSIDSSAAERYVTNRLTVVRQVHTKTGAIPDVVLAVNGLPVATLELKNAMSATGWTVKMSSRNTALSGIPKTRCSRSKAVVWCILR